MPMGCGILEHSGSEVKSDRRCGPRSVELKHKIQVASQAGWDGKVRLFLESKPICPDCKELLYHFSYTGLCETCRVKLQWKKWSKAHPGYGSRQHQKNKEERNAKARKYYFLNKDDKNAKLRAKYQKKKYPKKRGAKPAVCPTCGKLKCNHIWNPLGETPYFWELEEKSNILVKEI